MSGCLTPDDTDSKPVNPLQNETHKWLVGSWEPVPPDTAAATDDTTIELPGIKRVTFEDDPMLFTETRLKTIGEASCRFTRQASTFEITKDTVDGIQVTVFVYTVDKIELAADSKDNETCTNYLGDQRKMIEDKTLILSFPFEKGEKDTLKINEDELFQKEQSS